MPSLDHERELGDPVMGIDEAGRGPLAGPVVAAAVSLPLALAGELITGAWAEVNDSKKLTAARRDALAETIKATPGCLWAIASASPEEIDRLNILKATHLAMRRAALALAENVPASACPVGTQPAGGACPDSQAPSCVPPFSILVDGLPVPTLPFPSRNLVKGDAKSLFIAAASILAKTARDAYCLEMEAKYPGYGFARHKGYPTAEHLEALRRLGPCPEHRRSFGPVREQWLW
ncbi:MAG: ribonuclease HII [Kiritimatiellae bacterium]|nr:ribonuclease HII [Kiritimatiellia bacterium]